MPEIPKSPSQNVEPGPGANVDPGNGGSSPSGGPGPGAPDDPFVRFDARLLDPTTADRLPDNTIPSITTYRGDTLIITARDQPEAEFLVGEVVKAIEGTGLVVVDERLFEPAPAGGNRLATFLQAAAALSLPLVYPIRLEYADRTEITTPVDVWPVLQRLRNRRNAEQLTGIGLDHLMWSAAIWGSPYPAKAAAVISGSPYPAKAASVINGNPYPAKAAAAGSESYLQPSTGGHGPVYLELAPPTRAGRPPEGTRFPKVVVLDTGVDNTHPWFTGQPAVRDLKLNGYSIGLDPADQLVKDTDPEGKGAVPDPMTGLLATHAGHGTFIAGLLRQGCPATDIVALRIMGADGVVPESELTTALLGLAVLAHRSDPHPRLQFDALVLALGYYAEVGDDPTYTAGLKNLLAALAGVGVVSFVAAGNDTTQQRCYPAAFALAPEFAEPELPLVSVAALYPDKTVALFSNDGDWVVAEAEGANVVSTAPETFQGSVQSGIGFAGPGGTRRATLDPDNFRSGFATWSGTSFAAPVLAGRYLAKLAPSGVAGVSHSRELVLSLLRPVRADAEPPTTTGPA